MNPEKVTEQTPKVNPFLARTLARKEREVAAAKQALRGSELRARVRDLQPARPWSDALAGPGVRVIAEIKRRSPSAGALDEDVDPVARARLYESAGAGAISVLTDAAFGGSLRDLEAVSSAASVPVLRKEFIVDPYEIWRSRAHGADAVLLIASIVDDGRLSELVEAAQDAAVSLLVEIHSVPELDRIAAHDLPVVGVNARDLATLEVSVSRGLQTLRSARNRLGATTVLVAESGIGAPDDVAAVAASGADAILVGEHLMRASDPEAALRSLVSAGRAS